MLAKSSWASAERGLKDSRDFKISGRTPSVIWAISTKKLFQSASVEPECGVLRNKRPQSFRSTPLYSDLWEYSFKRIIALEGGQQSYVLIALGKDYPPVEQLFLPLSGI